MTPLQREALQMCLEYIETDAHERRHVRWKINEALAEPATEDSSAVQSEEHKGAIEVSVIFHEGQRMFAVPKQPAQQQEPVAPAFVINTSKGGRGFVEWYFSSVLKRHDFTDYIRTSLAADFACALAKGLSTSRPYEPI